VLQRVFSSIDRDRSHAIGFDDLYEFILGRKNHLNNKTKAAALTSRKDLLSELRTAWLDGKGRQVFKQDLGGSNVGIAKAEGSTAAPDLPPIEKGVDDGNQGSGEAVASRSQLSVEAPSIPSDAELQGQQAWSHEELRGVLNELLKSMGFCSMDVLRACDRDSSHVVSQKEFLTFVKQIFVRPARRKEVQHETSTPDVGTQDARAASNRDPREDELDFWDEKVRPAIISVFRLHAGLDLEMEAAELECWLVHGTSLSAFERKAQRLWKKKSDARPAPTPARRVALPQVSSARGAHTRSAATDAADALGSVSARAGVRSRVVPIAPMSMASLQQQRLYGDGIGMVDVEAPTSEFEAERRYWVLQLQATRCRVDAVRRRRKGQLTYYAY